MFKITPIHQNMTFLSAGEMLEPGLLLLLGHSVTALGRWLQQTTWKGNFTGIVEPPNHEEFVVGKLRIQQ